MLASVSLEVAVRVTCQNGTILGMPTAHVSSLPQGSPEPISAGEAWAFWTDRGSLGAKIQSTSLSFRHISGGNEQKRGCPSDGSLERTLFSGYADYFLGSGASSLQHRPNKTKKSANLVTAISSSLLLCPPGGRCSAGPCENVQIPPVEG